MRNKLIGTLCVLLSLAALNQSCQSEQDINYQRYYVNGKGLYEKHCQSCHGSRGEGLGTLYPPLTDTSYLSQNRNRLACIIRYGQEGFIEIHDKEYNGKMPGNARIPEIDVAQLIVYITNSFGNKQGYYDAAQIAEDLKACN